MQDLSKQVIKKVIESTRHQEYHEVMKSSRHQIQNPIRKSSNKLGLSCANLSKLKLPTHQLTNLALLSSSELSWGSQLRRAKNKLFLVGGGWLGGLVGEAGNKTNSGLLSWGLAELPT